MNRLRSSNVVRPFHDLEAIQPGLRNIRAIRYRYRNPFASDTFHSAGELASKLGSLSGTSSFDLLASDILREDCLRHPNDSEHWWTPLMHKWLAAEHTALLLSLDSSGDTKSPEIYKLAKWTAGECFRFVADEVRPVNTLVAEKLLRRFGQLCTECYLNVVRISGKQGLDHVRALEIRKFFIRSLLVSFLHDGSDCIVLSLLSPQSL